MKFKTLILAALLGVCFFSGGCATILTMSVPSVEEVSYGEKDVGRQISINYIFFDKGKTGTLMSQPYCFELAREKILTRKRIHGAGPAFAEIAVFGLGLFDLVFAGVYSKASEEETTGDFVETGTIIECGEFEPAANTGLIVQCSETGQRTELATDSSGNIEIDKLFQGFHKNTQINLFVRDEGGFAYVTTLENNY